MTTTNSTINKSRLFKRAWYLVKTKYYSLSFALKAVWSELKAAINRTTNELALVESLQNPQNSVSTTFSPLSDTMQSYYNSNAYKGD